MSIGAGLLKSLSAKTTLDGKFHFEMSMSVIGILLVILGKTRQFNLFVITHPVTHIGCVIPSVLKELLFFETC